MIVAADPGRSDGDPTMPSWPSSFPHREIEDLISTVGDARTTDPDDAARLLAHVAREAQRLRTTVARLSAARVARAEQEAGDIIALAHSQADEVRRLALRAVDDRLDESEQLIRSMRRAFLVEHLVSGNDLVRPRTSADGEP